MKIALCISGQIRSDAQKNVERLEKYFEPDTTVLATWSNQDTNIEKMLYYEEPVMHYNPALEIDGDIPQTYMKYIRNGMAKRDFWKHRTKQILIHAYLLRDISEKYDMIIRARFDTIISDVVEVKNLLRESYDHNKAIGFYVPKGQNLKHLNKLEKHDKNHNRCLEHLVDHLIMHPRKLFDIEKTLSMHEQKKLIVAETGWWQVLSKDHNSNHDCYLGFAGVDKEK